MYSVATIVIPIDYACNTQYAIQKFNATFNRELTDLDTRILVALSNATRGTPAMQLRKQVQINEKNVFSATFNTAINRLIEYEYITRAPWRRWIYYNITLRGRNAVAQLNQCLIDLVNEEMKRRNKQ